jgi:hypothetical protein
MSFARPLAADRDASVITPSGSPVWLDPVRALLFDSPAVAVMLENHHTAPVTTALRIWIFDPDLRLRGSTDYCAAETMDRNTRGQVLVPLEIRGVTTRDRAVITLSAVAYDGGTWRMREAEPEQLKVARAVAEGAPAHLAFDREDGGVASWECGCDARAVEARCLDRCAGTGLATHAATRLLVTGCVASCTCR